MGPDESEQPRPSRRAEAPTPKRYPGVMRLTMGDMGRDGVRGEYSVFTPHKQEAHELDNGNILLHHEISIHPDLNDLYDWNSAVLRGDGTIEVLRNNKKWPDSTDPDNYVEDKPDADGVPQYRNIKNPSEGVTNVARFTNELPKEAFDQLNTLAKNEYNYRLPLKGASTVASWTPLMEGQERTNKKRRSRGRSSATVIPPEVPGTESGTTAAERAASLFSDRRKR